MIRPARIPYKLPPKRQRPKSGIERAPKRIWLRHRKFVRSHQCCVPGCPTPHVVDVAHLRSVAHGAGTSLKPHDAYTVPLCRNHHLEQEAAGPDAFGDRHAIDLWELAAELVRRSPDVQMRLSIMLDEAGEPVTADTVDPWLTPPPPYRIAGKRARLVPIEGRVS